MSGWPFRCQINLLLPEARPTSQFTALLSAVQHCAIYAMQHNLTHIRSSASFMVSDFEEGHPNIVALTGLRECKNNLRIAPKSQCKSMQKLHCGSVIFQGSINQSTIFADALLDLVMSCRTISCGHTASMWTVIMSVRTPIGFRSVIPANSHSSSPTNFSFRLLR